MHLDPEYVASRRVLLDALDVLTPHLDNLILIGAQAVYIHTGDNGNLAVAPMTTDADLAINTNNLADIPEISSALHAAGFQTHQNPGHWINTSDIAIDLMVVPHQSGSSRPDARAARLAPHGKQTARIARGLEPALVDNTMLTLTSLESHDSRSYQLRVAGPAALLTAKIIKISERLDQAERQPDRLKEKDALDAFRILQAVDTADLVTAIKLHFTDPYAAATTGEALDILRSHATLPEAPLPQLAARSAHHDPAVAPSFVALAKQLLRAMG